MTEDIALAEPGIVTKVRPRSVADMVSRLTELVAANGLKLFDVIDQAAEATRWSWCKNRRGPDRAAGAVNARLCFSPRLAADPGADGTYIR